MRGFDPSNGTIKEFTEFCERLERTVEDNKVQPEKKKLVNFKDRQGKKSEKQKGRSSHNSKLYCILHKPNQYHDSNNCTHLKREAETHKKNIDNKGKKLPKKINRFGEEVHTLLEFATKAMNDAKAENRRKTKTNSITLSV